MSQLQNALRTLAAAMSGRGDEHEELPDDEHEPVSDQPPMRAMNYMFKPKDGDKKQQRQRAANAAADDSPLTMPRMILAPREKKAAA